MTNEGFGLLRVLSAEISSFLLLTFAVIVVTACFNSLAKADVGAERSAHTRRTAWKVGFWFWVLLSAVFVAQALSTTASLRIPRSDVDATGVYQTIDSHSRRHQ